MKVSIVVNEVLEIAGKNKRHLHPTDKRDVNAFVKKLEKTKHDIDELIVCLKKQIE